MIEEKKITITEDVLNICREIGKVCQNSGLRQFSGRFTPYNSEWGTDVSFSWEAGRHGEDSNKIYVQSEYTAHIQINEPKNHEPTR